MKISIVYYSQYGHTAKQAHAVLEGVSDVDGVEGHLYEVNDIMDNVHILDDSAAIIFGSPTYMGSVAADFKKFMDSTSPIWLKQGWKNKIAAGFTNSHSLSGDKLNTLVQLAIFGTQHSMIWVGNAEMNGSPSDQQGQQHSINRMGVMLGAAAQSDNASADITPPMGDLKTASKLGERVATIAKAFHL